MSSIKSSFRKVVVILVGFPLIGLGIILIPLPGPGLLVSLLGFLVLSLEFQWAETRVQQAKRELRKIYQKGKG